MTPIAAQNECQQLGFTLLRRNNEYIVKPIGARSDDDSQVCFASNLMIAVQMAHLMAREV
jgi:hypothetical protein